VGAVAGRQTLTDCGPGRPLSPSASHVPPTIRTYKQHVKKADQQSQRLVKHASRRHKEAKPDALNAIDRAAEASPASPFAPGQSLSGQACHTRAHAATPHLRCTL
jgi:hypothetical protein